MKKTLHLSLLTGTLLACAAVTASAADPAPTVVATTSTLYAVSRTEFTCPVSNRGACNYLILTSLCQEKFADTGVKQKTCQYTMPVPSFQLEPGASKTVANLPADYLYAMRVGVRPTVDEVLRSPTPH